MDCSMDTYIFYHSLASWQEKEKEKGTNALNLEPRVSKTASRIVRTVILSHSVRIPLSLHSMSLKDEER